MPRHHFTFTRATRWRRFVLSLTAQHKISTNQHLVLALDSVRKALSANNIRILARETAKIISTLTLRALAKKKGAPERAPFD